MKKIFVVALLSILTVSLAVAWQNSGDESDFQSKSFTVKKGGLLIVDVEPGAVRIETWSKDEVHVDADGIDERHPDRLVINQSGNNVNVKYRDSRHRNNNIQFSVKIPISYNVDIHTSGGSIKQRNKLDGNFKAETNGGSVEIDEITGTVDVETGGGSIEAKYLVGDATLVTGGGSIEIKKSSASLSLKTGGGSIQLGDVNGKTTAATGGGSIKAGNADESIELSTGGGSIRINGASKGAKVQTGGGSVELENIHGFVFAKTGGGSIDVELIPDASGKSTITTGGGDISLSLPGNAKATIEATIDQHQGWGRHKKCRIVSEFKADIYEGDDESDEIHAVYTLNGGGQKITLKTSNSIIELRKIADK